MNGTTQSRIREMISKMDTESLKRCIYRLSETLGEEESETIVHGIALSNAQISRDEAYDRTMWALDMDKEEWYAIACRDEYGHYVDSGDHAYEVILERLHEEFDDDLANILDVDPESAPEFIRGIADAIGGCNSILFEENEDLRRGLPRHMMECIEDGCCGDALDY